MKLGIGVSLLLFSFGFPSLAQEVAFENLEIFHRLAIGQVGLMADGSMFVLDEKDNRLFRIGPGEKNPELIATKGMGPGELNQARYISKVGDRLFVFQIRGYAEFDSNGKFVTQHQPFDLNKAAIPLKDGFILYDPAALNLSFTEAPSAELKPLWHWQDVRLYPERPKPYTYYPAWEMAKVMVHHDTEQVFVVHAGISLKISVIDLTNGERKAIERPELQAPAFNERWAQSEYDKRFKGNQVKLATPKRFPLVKHSWLGPGDTLVLELWTADPDLKQHFLVLDHDGKPATLAFDPKCMERVVAFDDSQAVVSVFDDENGASLVRCVLDRVDEVAAKYPYTEAEPEDGWVAIQ